MTAQTLACRSVRDWTPTVDCRSTSLSRDGKLAAVGIGPPNPDVWVSELARGTLTRVTTDAAVDVYPLWTPDGRRVVFSSNRSGSWELFWKAGDGTGGAELLLTLDAVDAVVPTDWSSDGSTLFVHATLAGTGRDIGVVSVDDPGGWKPLIQSPANEWGASLSPDGRWLAYTSNETGVNEIYVLRYPELEDRRLISVGGGSRPKWSTDGRELIYLSQSQGEPAAVVRVTLDTDEGDPPSLIVGTTEALFEWGYHFAPGGAPVYDMSSDGQRFLVLSGGGDAEAATRAQINIVLNWTEELKRLVPVP